MGGPAPGQIRKRVAFAQLEHYGDNGIPASHRSEPGQFGDLYAMNNSGLGRESSTLETVRTDPRPLHGTVPVMSMVDRKSYKYLTTPSALINQFHDIAEYGWMDPNFVYLYNTDNFGRPAYPISATAIDTTQTATTVFLDRQSKGYSISSGTQLLLVLGLILLVGSAGQLGSQ